MGGRCIYQTSKGVCVYQNLNYRWLTFNSKAIQTIINRRHLEKAELKYIPQLGFAVREQPAPSCLLGLGGAAMAHFLAPYLNTVQLTAVEQDPEVIHIAEHYFMSKHLKNLLILQREASQFVHQHTLCYQHVLVDLFDAQHFPSVCNTVEFFANCRNLLLPKGILAVNLANPSEQWPIFQHIQSNFKQCTVSLPVRGTANLVILACKDTSITPLLSLFQKNPSIKKLSWDTKWGCVAEI